MQKQRWKTVLSLVLTLTLLWCGAAPLTRAAAAVPAGGLALTAEEQAFVAAHPTLRVGFVQDRIPVSFSDENGDLAGISRYIFDRAAALCGFTFEYVPLPGGSVTYDYLMSERLDLVTSVEYNKENLNARGIHMSQPYLTSRKVVVARQDLEFSFDTPLTAAVSTGSQTLHKVLADTYPNFTLEDYDTIDACFRAVVRGDSDLMIQNQYVAEYWLAKPAYEGLKAIPVLGLDDELCFSAVVDFTGEGSPTDADGDMLIGILNKAIAAMTEDEIGSYTIRAVMENRYTYTLGDFLSRYRYAVGIFIVATTVICILVFLLYRQRIRSMEARADAKAKGQFLSTMSHEIRTPLNGLIGLNYLMSQKLDDRERLEGYLRQSTTTAKYLLSLVNDILDISKLQEQKMELLREPVDLKLLLSTVCSIVQTPMEEKGLTFTVQVVLPCPCVVGDAVRIQQVLMNLLDNARKFTPAGGSVTLRVAQTTAEDGCIVTQADVIDTGRGMSEAFQKRVFHSFAQELDTVSKGNQGTGLGMPISQELARLMDGDLTFTSKKDQGSHFVFTFKGQPAEMPGLVKPSGAAAARPRVLVAEDNELNAEIMQELLSDEAFDTVLATNGKEALRMFADSPVETYGVVLMDLLMPEMDGFQAAMAIRALDRPDARTVRIIACTANSFAEDRDKALQCGMNDFVSKPVNVEELLRKLAQ